MAHPGTKSEGSWLSRVRDRVRGGRTSETEGRSKPRGKRMDARRIEGARRQDKHDPMGGPGGSAF